jgi:hypothetical protein
MTVIDIPLELKLINESFASVISATGQKMCERLDKQAETARKKCVRTGARRDLAAWVGRSSRAENARLLVTQWKEGKL